MAEAPGPVWPQDHAPLLTTQYIRSIFMTDKVPPSLLAHFVLLSVPDKEEGSTLEKILNIGITAFGGRESVSMVTVCQLPTPGKRGGNAISLSCCERQMRHYTPGTR